MSAGTTDWDGRAYERLSAPQEEWARRVLKRLPLRGDEIVLDAGCGSGRVTRLLLERLPRGGVIGVDGSPSMVQTAQESFAGEDRVTLIVSNLLELSPELLRHRAGTDSVDAVFSNATFHWIKDHDALFERILSVLRPGGRLVAQCGGKGNVAVWLRAVDEVGAREPFAEHLSDFEPWNFYGPEQTERRLRRAGFEQISTELVEVEPVEPEDPREFLTVVGLAAHNDRLPEELREPFGDAVVEALPKPVELRYIRLNIDARRPGGEGEG
ncbi:MAG: methyltransferase domain-containing protein [Thermoleophilaceae bacterium]